MIIKYIHFETLQVIFTVQNAISLCKKNETNQQQAQIRTQTTFLEEMKMPNMRSDSKQFHFWGNMTPFVYLVRPVLAAIHLL